MFEICSNIQLATPHYCDGKRPLYRSFIKRRYNEALATNITILILIKFEDFEKKFDVRLNCYACM
jgi:hypothetical protein